MKNSYVKVMLIFIVGFIQIHRSHSQVFPSDCYSYSPRSFNIKESLERLSCREGMDFYYNASISIMLLKRFYDRQEKPTEYCDVLTFARLFDFLLVNGLDLDFDYANCRPVIISVVGSFFDSYVKELKETNRISRENENTFEPFVRLNQFYSEKILLPFEKNPNVDILNIINQIERCENLSFPKQVTTIIRGHFRELTIEKYYHLPPKK